MSIDLIAAPAARPASQGAQRWPFSVSVVIPARNEAASIGRVVRGVLEQCPDAEVLVVDDASTDRTAEEAEAAGARVIRRPYNIGNGAGIKTGVRNATGDVLIVIDADGQHDPADIPRLLRHIGPYDMVIGERDRAGQQNWVRWAGNSALNRLGSYVVGMPMRDLTSGFRAMRRSVMLEFVHLLPNQFSWPTTSALAFAKGGYHIRFEPITVRRRESGQSAQKLLRNGIKFTLIILRIVSLFAPLRVFFPVSLAMVLLSGLAYLASVAASGIWLKIPNATVALFVGAVVIFMFGLLAEQIASLWYKGQNRDA
ncbi:MAG TPA: glycosyltransferase family 2 protein [Roseiflexaceae bacterium]|nr:glycosyltransferase family 2 protein [Roseiflexaceae bacterium]